MDARLLWIVLATLTGCGAPENNCPVPLLQLANAQAAVCVEPRTSRVDLTFTRAVRADQLAQKLSGLREVDLRNTTHSENRKSWQIVYYMSRTTEAKFLSTIVPLLNSPEMFD